MVDEKKHPNEEQNEAPPVAGEQNEDDPSVLGDLTEQENAVVQQIRRQMSNLTVQIGQTEIRKAALLEHLKYTEQQSEQIVQGISKRLGIPEGMMWRVEDGKARAVPGMDNRPTVSRGNPPNLRPVPDEKKEE